MKRTASILGGILIAAVVLAAPVKTTVAELVKSPEKFDGKEIIVSGKVKAHHQKQSRRGNAYTVFKLVDGKKEISVYMRSHAAAKAKANNGDTVQLTGIFKKEKTIGSVVFRNEIDVTKKTGKPYGVKITKRAK
jgi:RecG-like helicase